MGTPGGLSPFARDDELQIRVPGTTKVGNHGPGPYDESTHETENEVSDLRIRPFSRVLLVSTVASPAVPRLVPDPTCVRRRPSPPTVRGYLDPASGRQYPETGCTRTTTSFGYEEGRDVGRTGLTSGVVGSFPRRGDAGGDAMGCTRARGTRGPGTDPEATVVVSTDPLSWPDREDFRPRGLSGPVRSSHGSGPPSHYPRPSQFTLVYRDFCRDRSLGVVCRRTDLGETTGRPRLLPCPTSEIREVK